MAMTYESWSAKYPLSEKDLIEGWSHCTGEALALDIEHNLLDERLRDRFGWLTKQESDTLLVYMSLIREEHVLVKAYADECRVRGLDPFMNA